MSGGHQHGIENKFTAQGVTTHAVDSVVPAPATQSPQVQWKTAFSLFTSLFTKTLSTHPPMVVCVETSILETLVSVDTSDLDTSKKQRFPW
jgi:hypothetical protein